MCLLIKIQLFRVEMHAGQCAAFKAIFDSKKGRRSYVVCALPLATLATLELVSGCLLGGAPLRVPKSMFANFRILLLATVASQLLWGHCQQAL